MRVNVNNPSFIAFLESVTRTILSTISIENYFSLPQEKKMGILYIVFKTMKGSVKGTKLTDLELKAFVVVLLKKNEEIENYEFAAILKDIINNFDAINEMTTNKVTTKRGKTIKTDKNNG
jgi:hypothetical protein